MWSKDRESSNLSIGTMLCPNGSRSENPTVDQIYRHNILTKFIRDEMVSCLTVNQVFTVRICAGEQFGTVAPMVERSLEASRVAGSNPARSTKSHRLLEQTFWNYIIFLSYYNSMIPKRK